MSVIEDLLKLSHEIGREDRDLALLGEGNTSAKLSDDTYLVKASGTSLSTLTADDVVECHTAALVQLLENEAMTDQQVNDALLAARVHPNAKKPSVEAVFHAWAMTLPGVRFAGHCHPVAVNQILCSPRAQEFAENRMFADEIVCGGVASVFVPLTDPGLELAQVIRRETGEYVQKYERLPKVILLQNHGMISVGATWQSVLAAILMTEKAARIFTGAAQLGGPNFLSKKTIDRIATRPDELYRQRILNV